MSEERRDPTPRGRIRTMQVMVAALLVVGLLTAIFVIQNTASARIAFLVWEGSFPLAGALLLSAVLGGILGFLAAYLYQRQLRRAFRRDQQAADQQAAEEGNERPEPPR